ncbi:hypothetical protein [Microvirga sp. BSC39]|uniref:hypothetical protein n=1 Tax=Microvirga sp. BSC39 TaxID=1549810 RepID=UPI000A96EF45|nr:hypothetical protein [Microvirga sp. BSC39]
MRVAIFVVAVLLPATSLAQSDVWSIEVLERYASWVREGGFACPIATRIAEVEANDGGTVFKVTCGPATLPLTGEEVAFRLTVRPNGSRLAEPWRE